MLLKIIYLLACRVPGAAVLVISRGAIRACRPLHVIIKGLPSRHETSSLEPRACARIDYRPQRLSGPAPHLPYGGQDNMVCRAT
jgi:hypothetical protein